METLETPYGNFTIYVNRLTLPEENLLHISFVDKRNKTHVVLMRHSMGNWVFRNIKNTPLWIVSMQDLLNDLILKQVVERQGDNRIHLKESPAKKSRACCFLNRKQIFTGRK